MQKDASILSQSLKHALFLFLCLMCVGFSACSGAPVATHKTPAPSATSLPTTTPAPSATSLPITTPAPSPPFLVSSQWQVAYIDKTGTLHGVTLDGKHDQTGLQIQDPELTLPHYSTNFLCSAISPDGHTVSMDLSQFMTIDIHGITPVRLGPLQFLAYYEPVWSPQGDKEAVTGGDYNFYIINTRNGTPVQIPYDNHTNRSDLLGWIDDAHLLLGIPTPVSGNTGDIFYTIDSLDITTGKATAIGTLYHSGMPAVSGTISPDGKTVFISDREAQDLPYSSVVATMNLQTGQITQYPHIAAVLQNKDSINSTVWKPGSQELVLTTGFQENNDLQTWIVHLATDTITPLVANQYATAWNAETNTILTISANNGMGDGGSDLDRFDPITIYANALDQQEHPISTLLTKDAYFTSSLGFIPPSQP